MKTLLFFTLIIFSSFCLNAQNDMLLLKTNGKVVIGDTSIISTPGDYSLYVQKGMLTEKVKVSLKSSIEWSDKSFQLTPSLEQVKASIDENSHLHNMPSADYLVKEGYELKSMDAKLLEQIEWLWQYTLKLSEENKKMKIELDKIKKSMANKQN